MKDQWFSVKGVVVNHSDGSVLMNLRPEQTMPGVLAVLGHLWVRKPEHHVTLLSRKHGLMKLIGDDGSKRCRFGQIVADFVGKPPVIITSTEIRHVVREYEHPVLCKRQTLIMMCAVPQAEWLYATLQHEFGLDVGVVPHHVTTYTLNDSDSRQGIGLINEAELNQFSQVLANDVYMAICSDSHPVE